MAGCKTLREINDLLVARFIRNLSLFCATHDHLFIKDPKPMTIDDLEPPTDDKKTRK